MLIKITNFCSMGCNHCMEDSTVAGKHMSRETFTAALALTARLEGALVSMTCNKCGLVDNLTQAQKLAIGEARIHLR